MNIVLIGYGKMGKAIEKIALQRNHEIIEIVEVGEEYKLNSKLSECCDVAVEFSNPLSSEKNIKKCLENGISVVCGTTGWKFDTKEITEFCKKNDSAFFYSSNYSIGMNIFFEINKKLAELLKNHENYSVEIDEIHHIHKLDKPSGTAITLANEIISNSDKYTDIKINSIRDGEVVGTHKVVWESEIDKIIIQHEAKTREGFALGAIIAAEFIVGKIGFYTMKELLNYYDFCFILY